ncbi:MAG: methyl-accepting chemotaxis protein, partial [Candidatus Omnitrophica bacterium]|nr:methyl-accepting chemotaxis protein [Candidatus Omnitrophota bacterium]
MHALRNLKIKYKLLVLLFVTGVVPLITALFISFNSSKHTVIDMTKEKLSAVGAIKNNQISAYFDTIDHQVRSLSFNPTTVHAAKEFAKEFFAAESQLAESYAANKSQFESQLKERYVYQAENTEGVGLSAVERWMPQKQVSRILQSLYISENPNPIGAKENFDDAGDGSTYSKLHKKYHPFFRDFLRKFGYYDIFIVEPKEGHIVYSVFKEVDYATSLFTGPYANTNFGRVVQAAFKKNADDAVLEDFEYYEPSYNAPASFIASPIYDGGEVVGVLCFQMPVDRINDIMQEKTGMGESGETYLVGPDKLMRSNSRFSEDPTLLVQKIDSPTVGLGLNDEQGVMKVKDYRGIDVWSAYTHLKYEKLNWVTLAEIDDAEAMIPVKVIFVEMLILLAVILIVIVVLGLGFNKMLMNVINSMVENLKDIAQGEGDLTKSIQVDTKDELGELAGWFNTFIQKLEGIICQVKDAAEQLATAVEEVSSSSQQISDGAQQQSASFEQLSSSVQANASNAQSANEVTQESANNADRIGQKMDQTIDAITTIETSSKQIADAIAIITDIADQTNLLA